MGIQIIGNGGTLVGAGQEASLPMHISLRPIPGVGHYRVSGRFVLLPSQAANSRLWCLRNNGANIIIPTRLEVRWTHTAAHTAAILDSLDLYKLTGFTTLDTTNTQTLTPSSKRTSMPASSAQIRAVQAAGLAAGMTGATSTKDASPAAIVEQWLLLAQPTAGPVDPVVKELLTDENGTHPFALVQNEGLLIENRNLLGAAAGSSVTVDLSYAEVTAF